MKSSLIFILTVQLVSVLAVIPPPERFVPFLTKNKLPAGLPLSYNVWPGDYFEKIPPELRPTNYNASKRVPHCGGKMVSPKAMNAYEYQTEKYLTTLGLNIYDAAVRCIALTLLGYWDECANFNANVLLQHRTLQFADIRGDAPCAGVMFSGECDDPEETGRCGFCYGDNQANRSQDKNHAYFFRMISDYWSLQGTTDLRCPERNQTWTWNDYAPILGENAWAALLGTLVSAYNGTGGNVELIEDDGPELTLAINLVTMLEIMKVGDTGSFYYAPRNVWFLNKPNQGSTVSVENQASLLAGLKALRYVLLNKESTKWEYLLPKIDSYIDGLQRFILEAYSPQIGVFRQGGRFDQKTRVFTWTKDLQEDYFAVDCQTWVSSALGARLIDATYGEHTAYNLWQKVKALSGYYGPGNSSRMIRGVGYTVNAYDGNVFSGEWTLGAINWLYIMISESDYDDTRKQVMLQEAINMRLAIEEELTVSQPLFHTRTKMNATAVVYANRRHFIPFGWWANPLQALASTGWAVAVDLGFNPLMVDGRYASQYPE